jgi:hypothetical protein
VYVPNSIQFRRPQSGGGYLIREEHMQRKYGNSACTSDLDTLYSCSPPHEKQGCAGGRVRSGDAYGRGAPSNRNLICIQC